METHSFKKFGLISFVTLACLLMLVLANVSTVTAISEVDTVSVYEGNEIPFSDSKYNTTNNENMLHVNASSGSVKADSISSAVTTVSILPLGDSVTQGDTQYNSYRRPLWHMLNDAGYDIDFVGSLTTNAGGAAPNPDFDLDHEGHAGWRADQVEDSLPGWLGGYTPDIVLLHVGHNDLNRVDRNGSVVQATVDDVDGIIDALRDDNPNVTVLLAQLIASCRPIREANIVAFNALIPDYAAGKTTVDSPVVVVDQFTGFDANADTFDCSHPNEVGEQKMADRWYDALTVVLDNSPAPTSTPLSPTSTPLPPTNTPVLPTATNTLVPPTNTPMLPTNTPLPPTNTPVPPTATNTPLPPTATHTPLPPTATNTPAPPTATPTNTPIPPTSTPTNTPPPPSPTSTPGGTPITTEFVAVADTYIAENKTSSNFGGSRNIAVGGGAASRIIYLRFDLSSLPAGAVVTDAELQLTASNAGGGGTIRAFAPDDPSWSESTPTWDDPLAGTDASGDLASLPSVSRNVDYAFTGLESAIIENGMITFVIRSEDGDGAAYRSTEYSNADTHPTLVVTYLAP